MAGRGRCGHVGDGGPDAADVRAQLGGHPLQALVYGRGASQRAAGRGCVLADARSGPGHGAGQGSG
ncbi:hypothetical protein SDC9_187008 [bioreactor metagenome]|uniref:Uncharacterized protein n=1 Tax=bioreactor metagenome TaxID=1076179 RepID=A0A645HL53_9ZZZZ